MSGLARLSRRSDQVKVGSKSGQLSSGSFQSRSVQNMIRSRSGHGHVGLGRSDQGRLMSGQAQVKVMSKSSLVKVRSGVARSRQGQVKSSAGQS